MTTNSTPRSDEQDASALLQLGGRTFISEADAVDRANHDAVAAVRATLVAGDLSIAERLPHPAVAGGCCGTDLEHLDHISVAFAGRPARGLRAGASS